ncbi:hypothetical protein GQ600_10095 [Phytophthora cactorum]|nr:hypothetical protein GQ600_10095 [Phytophthora cactorum]
MSTSPISMAGRKLLDSLDEILKEEPLNTLNHPTQPFQTVSARGYTKESAKAPDNSSGIPRNPIYDRVPFNHRLFGGFMPLFYCCYMLVMTQLPNAQYHTEMAGVTRDNVIATILPLFVSCRLFYCGGDYAELWHESSVQLAFVLTTQRSLVLCKMLLWMVITLSFRVIHFGKTHAILLFILYSEADQVLVFVRHRR